MKKKRSSGLLWNTHFYSWSLIICNNTGASMITKERYCGQTGFTACIALHLDKSLSKGGWPAKNSSWFRSGKQLRTGSHFMCAPVVCGYQLDFISLAPCFVDWPSSARVLWLLFVRFTPLRHSTKNYRFFCAGKRSPMILARKPQIEREIHCWD